MENTSFEAEKEAEELFNLYNFILETLNKKSDNKVKVISIVGGAGSGKTTFARNFVEFLINTTSSKACTLSTDDYVIGDRKFRKKIEAEGKPPIAKYKPEKLNKNIAKIKKLTPDDEPYAVPTYNDKTGEAIDAETYTKKLTPVDYIIVEGDFDFVETPDLLIYFDVDDKTRLDNRINRDLLLRGATDVDSIIESFNKRQKTQHYPYTAPTKEKADIVISAKKEDSKNPNSRYSYSVIVNEFKKNNSAEK